jgi:DNA-binding GntR family transcriptional regulator
VIKRKSDEAYAALRSQIMCAQLPPGAPLDERALMEALGVGRTPLREAVLRLEHERLVRSLGRRGYIVAETSPLDLFRAFELRREIECFAASCAAERRTEADLEAFKVFLARAEEGMERMAANMPWNLGVDEQFHSLVAEASDNRFVSETLAYLYGLSVRSLYTSRVPATLVREEMAIYREVLEAIARRDRAAAADAMGRHLTVSPIANVVATGGTVRARRGAS